MRTRYALCRHCGEMHAYSAWPHNCRDEPWPRSDHPAPYIVSDNLPGGVNGMWSPVTGRPVDSKHAYYRQVRAAGCEVVGDDKAARKEPGADRYTPSEDDVGRDLKAAHEMLSSDNVSNDEMANMMRAFNGPADAVLDAKDMTIAT